MNLNPTKHQFFIGTNYIYSGLSELSGGIQIEIYEFNSNDGALVNY